MLQSGNGWWRADKYHQVCGRGWWLPHKRGSRGSARDFFCQGSDCPTERTDSQLWQSCDLHPLSGSTVHHIQVLWRPRALHKFYGSGLPNYHPGRLEKVRDIVAKEIPTARVLDTLELLMGPGKRTRGPRRRQSGPTGPRTRSMPTSTLTTSWPAIWWKHTRTTNPAKRWRWPPTWGREASPPPMRVKKGPPQPKQPTEEEKGRTQGENGERQQRLPALAAVSVIIRTRQGIRSPLPAVLTGEQPRPWQARSTHPRLRPSQRPWRLQGIGRLESPRQSRQGPRPVWKQAVLLRAGESAGTKIHERKFTGESYLYFIVIYSNHSCKKTFKTMLGRL